MTSDLLPYLLRGTNIECLRHDFLQSKTKFFSQVHQVVIPEITTAECSSEPEDANSLQLHPEAFRAPCCVQNQEQPHDLP